LSCGDKTCVRPYKALARTAELTKTNPEVPFMAVPFTGVIDMAFNALDGNKDNISDNKPSLGSIIYGFMIVKKILITLLGILML
jgi:uncharacterized membrane protein